MTKKYKIVFQVREVSPNSVCVVEPMQTIVEIDEDRAAHMGDAYVELMLDTGLDEAAKYIREHVKAHMTDPINS